MNIENIDLVKDALTNNSSVTILNKSFDGKIIDGLKLEGSIIVKSSFKGVKLYNSKFLNCDFIKDDFSNASLTILEFDGCVFHAIDFTNVKMENVTFKNDCKFINCIFSGIELGDQVVGLTEKYLNVIAEQNDSTFSLFKECGFEKKEDGSFEKSEGEFKIVLTEAPESKDGTWLMMFFNDADNCLFTQNFILSEDLTKAYFEAMIQYGLKIAASKQNK